MRQKQWSGVRSSSPSNGRARGRAVPRAHGDNPWREPTLKSGGRGSVWGEPDAAKQRRKEKGSMTIVNLLQIPRQGDVKLNPPLCESHRCGLQLDIAVSPWGLVFLFPPRHFGVS